MQETWPVLPPRNNDELWTLVSDTLGEVVSSSVTFDHWLSPWHTEWNRRSKHRGSRLLTTSTYIPCLSTVSMSKWGWNRPHGAYFTASGDPRRFAKQTVNTTERLQFINRNILFDKFIKSVIRLLDESWYFCVNFRLCVVNILTTSTKTPVRAESIHHFDYAAKYRLKNPK